MGVGGVLSEKFAQTSVSCPRGCGSAVGLGSPARFFFFVSSVPPRWRKKKTVETQKWKRERERENKGQRKGMRGDEGRTADILIMWAGCSA